MSVAVRAGALECGGRAGLSPRRRPPLADVHARTRGKFFFFTLKLFYSFLCVGVYNIAAALLNLLFIFSLSFCTILFILFKGTRRGM